MARNPFESDHDRRPGDAPPLPGHESALDPKPEWQPRCSGSGRLAGKVAIVTGTDSGIERAVAAREGADVATVYLLEEDVAMKTQAIVEAEGRRAITIRADVGSRPWRIQEKRCPKAVTAAQEMILQSRRAALRQIFWTGWNVSSEPVEAAAPFSA